MQYLNYALAALSYAAAMGGTYAAERVMDRYAVVAPSQQSVAGQAEEPAEEPQD